MNFKYICFINNNIQGPSVVDLKIMPNLSLKFQKYETGVISSKFTKNRVKNNLAIFPTKCI